MGTTAKATFNTLDWDEKLLDWDEKLPREEEDETKMTRAHVGYRYQGELVGESTVEYLMVYPEVGDASYVGVQLFVGTLAGKSGSFVLQHRGTANQTDVADSFEVIPGSATGELAGLRGHGTTVIQGHTKNYPFTIEYEFV